jgi:hypothetical protein
VGPVLHFIVAPANAPWKSSAWKLASPQWWWSSYRHQIIRMLLLLSNDENFVGNHVFLLVLGDPIGISLCVSVLRTVLGHHRSVRSPWRALPRSTGTRNWGTCWATKHLYWHVCCLLQEQK